MRGSEPPGPAARARRSPPGKSLARSLAAHLAFSSGPSLVTAVFTTASSPIHIASTPFAHLHLDQDQPCLTYIGKGIRYYSKREVKGVKGTDLRILWQYNTTSLRFTKSSDTLFLAFLLCGIYILDQAARILPPW